MGQLEPYCGTGKKLRVTEWGINCENFKPKKAL